MKKERRYVRFYITQEDMLDAIKGIKMMNFKDIPEDVEIAKIQYSLEVDGLDLILYHPTFSIVPDGQVIPRWRDMIMVVDTKNSVIERIAQRIKKSKEYSSVTKDALLMELRKL